MEPNKTEAIEGMILRVGVVQDYATDMVHLRLYDDNNDNDPNRHRAFCGLIKDDWYTPAYPVLDWPHQRVCVSCFAGFTLVPQEPAA